MSKSKLNTFQEKAMSTAGRTPELHGTIDTLVMCALGIAGESGEFVDNVKKVAYHGHQLTPELKTKMAYELGDQLWYIANAANALGFPLDQVAEMVLEKLAERYPEGHFTAERSINRVEYTERMQGQGKTNMMTDTKSVRQHDNPLPKPTFDREAAEKAAETVLNKP
jgi:NTP pyrophosphatase (non-canonical NTP hydrolase)